MFRHSVRLALILLVGTALFASASAAARAQTRTIEPRRPEDIRSLGITRRTGEFVYSGNDVGTVSFDFHEPLLGLSLILGSGLDWSAISVQTGHQRRGPETQDAELDLLETEVDARMDLRLLAQSDRVQLRLFSPISLGYRRLDVSNASVPVEPVRYGCLFLGLGLRLAARPMPQLTLEARSVASPGMTVVTLSAERFSDKFDVAWDNDLTAHWRPVTGARFGMTIGGTFRAERLKVPAAHAFPGTNRDMFPYRSTGATLRAGLNWR